MLFSSMGPHLVAYHVAFVKQVQAGYLSLNLNRLGSHICEINSAYVLPSFLISKLMEACIVSLIFYFLRWVWFVTIIIVIVAE